MPLEPTKNQPTTTAELPKGASGIFSKGRQIKSKERNFLSKNKERVHHGFPDTPTTNTITIK